LFQFRTTPRERGAVPLAAISLYIRGMTAASALPGIAEIEENFSFLDEWDDRYRYLIELGRALPPFPEALRTEATRVRGCTSQVWFVGSVRPAPSGPAVDFIGDSDSHIVRGLVAILISLYSGRPAADILATEPDPLFTRLGLREHLTPQRSNGLTAMVERIRKLAAEALAAEPSASA